MESGLLNAFHDDQYDGTNTFTKFDVDNNYWSEQNNDTLGIQLSETLNGILPITPNEEKLHYFNENDLNTGYSIEISTTKNSNFFANEEFNIIDENLPSSSLDEIEELPLVNSNSARYSFSSGKIILETNDNNYDENNFDRISNCSHLTFRSRTDSSSIGDYESHTSDEESDMDMIVVHQPICNDDYYFKNLSNLGDNIDLEVKNNNLIEENDDDPNLEINRIIRECEKEIYVNIHELDSENKILSTDRNKNKKNIVNICNNSDSSDIDIETVNDDNIQFIDGKSMEILINKKLAVADDFNNDPSWSPNKSCKKKDRHKKKHKKKEILQNEIKCKLNKVKTKLNFATIKSPKKLNKINFGVGLGGKNISLSHTSNETHKKEDVKKKKKEIITQKEELIKTPEPLEPANVINQENICIPHKPIRRKLNLDEYKRRRNGGAGIYLIDQNSSDSNSSNLTNTTSSTIRSSNLAQVANALKLDITVGEQIEDAVTSPSNFIKLNTIIKKPLPNPNSLLKKSFFHLAANQEKPLDPITEAKNKVLRMQELKRRAVQKRLIDITVSSKVGPITKILPLEEIVRNSKNNLMMPNPPKTNPDYEEIISVSIGCNTDINIPPILPKDSKQPSALHVISDTLEKVKNVEQVKISNSSLITSIHNVVLTKVVEGANENCSAVGKDENNEHGEDKVIMHLSKDRVREKKFSVSAQTNSLPEFPPLELLIKNYSSCLTGQERIKRRKYRSRKKSSTESDDERKTSKSVMQKSKKYHRNRQKRRRSSSSADSDYSRDRSRSRSASRSSTRSYSYSRSRSHSRSRSRSQSRSSRSRSRSRYERNNRPRNNRPNSPAVEERRIVYVGRIEDETNKEDLKSKFSSYGPIRQITIHYKDTGMKYGFVTFEKAEDAFQAIDNGPKNDKINMYDISFGGRRAFCRSLYSDLDGAATNSYESYSYYGNYGRASNKYTNTHEEDNSFEALLKKVKNKICATKHKDKEKSPKVASSRHHNK